MSEADPLAEAIASASGSGGKALKVDVVFGDRPEVLDAVRAARRRKPPVSYRTLGRMLTAGSKTDDNPDGTLISEGAVYNWCALQELP